MLDQTRDKLTALYSDKMTVVWDMSNKNQISMYRAFLSHNGPINDLKVMPDSNREILRFATGSSDKTVRIWNFYDYSNAELKSKVK